MRRAYLAGTMKRFVLLLAASVIVAAPLSCRKDLAVPDLPDDVPEPIDSSIVIIEEPTDTADGQEVVPLHIDPPGDPDDAAVLVAGSTLENGNYNAALWFDGQMLPLSVSGGVSQAFAVAVGPSGALLDRTYVCGIYGKYAEYPALWCGCDAWHRTVLDSLHGTSEELCVDNDAVYVCGSCSGDDCTFACIWKTDLWGNVLGRTDLCGEESFASDIVLKNGHTVVYGGIYDDEYSPLPVMWVDGEMTLIEAGKPGLYYPDGYVGRFSAFDGNAFSGEMDVCGIFGADAVCSWRGNIFSVFAENPSGPEGTAYLWVGSMPLTDAEPDPGEVEYAIWDRGEYFYAEDILAVDRQ